MSTPVGYERERFEHALRDAVARLERDGWTVEIEPPGEKYGLGAFRPDYVAKRGDEIIVGEVKSRARADATELTNLVKVVDNLPHARLDLTWLGAVKTETPPDATALLVERARRVAEVDYGAALVLAWGAIESATQQLQHTESDSDPAKSMSLQQELAEMASLGTISIGQYYRLSEIAKLRNQIAHGRTTAEPRQPLVEYACMVALAFASGQYFSVDSMIEWFFENYKDPVDGVPWDGGYLYVSGGPFDAEEVLSEEFESMPAEDIEDAASTLNESSLQWVRIEDY